MGEPITAPAPKRRTGRVPKAPPTGTPLSVHVKTPFGVTNVGFPVEAVGIFKETTVPVNGGYRRSIAINGGRLDKTVLDVTADEIHQYDIDPKNKVDVDRLLALVTPSTPLDADECIINFRVESPDPKLGPVPAPGTSFAPGPVTKSIRFKKHGTSFGPKTPVELEFTDNLQRIKGLDVSKHQGTIDWSVVKKSGLIEFVYIKCSHGQGGRDKMFAANWRGAGANKITRGAYHFFIPTVNPAEGEAQADWFVDELIRAGNAKTDFPPMIDVEFIKTHKEPKKDPITHQPVLDPKTNQPVMIIVADNPQPTTPKQNVASFKTFLARFQKRLNRSPILYTYPSYWIGSMMNSLEFHSSCHLWIAAYYGKQYGTGESSTFDEPPPGASPPLFGGWTNWSMWQYANHFYVPGIKQSKPSVDFNVVKMPRGVTVLDFLNAPPPT